MHSRVLSRIIRPRSLAGLCILTVIGGGCGAQRQWDEVPRPLPNLPAQFVADTSGGYPANRAAGAGCLVHLVDPASGARLRLVSSTQINRPSSGHGYIGHYSVTPQGSFGLRPGQGLRIDCDTGTPIGMVAVKTH
jgi:hypothetical protein